MRLRPASFPVTEAAVRHDTGDDGAAVLDLIRVAVVRHSNGEQKYHVLCRKDRGALAGILAVIEAADSIRAEMEGLR